MPENRHIFTHGLLITLRRLPAFLWTYLFDLVLAVIFSVGLQLQLSALLDHSLAAQRLSSGFDLGTLAEAYLHLHEDRAASTGGEASHASIVLYLLIYFVLVPGTLFCYQTGTPARLSTLLHQGLLHFWRFVRITLLTLLAFAILLGPLLYLQSRWADHVDEHAVGLPAFLLILAGNIVVFLVASILRLYFDLVEVYTVQLGQTLRDDGKPDHRVRYALTPAWRALTGHFFQAWPTFLFLTLLGFAAVILTARTSMHMLGQPRVWPVFLLAQLGLFLLLFTRFWQRGIETSLTLQNPILPTIDPGNPLYPSSRRIQLIPYSPPAPVAPEPISDPEPPSPSLDEPDPGVFHHTPTKPQ
jgi:hypothetical protein